MLSIVYRLSITNTDFELNLKSVTKFEMSIQPLYTNRVHSLLPQKAAVCNYYYIVFLKK